MGVFGLESILLRQKITLAILLVLTVGAIILVWADGTVVVSRLAYQRTGTFGRDTNHDGRTDLIENWQSGVLQNMERDTNEDGKMDAVTYFENGDPVRLEYDLDYNGEIDYRSVTDDNGRERIEVLRNGVFVEQPTAPPLTETGQ